MRKKNHLKRAGALLLSVALAISFMPVAGGTMAFAKTAGGEPAQLDPAAVQLAEESGIDTTGATAIVLRDAKGNKVDPAAMLDSATVCSADKVSAKAGAKGAETAEPALEENTTIVDEDSTWAPMSQRYLEQQKAQQKQVSTAYYEEDDDYVAPSGEITVSAPNKNGWVTVKGEAQNGTFTYLCVDGSTVYSADIYGKSSFTRKVDMKQYAVGYHDVSAQLNDYSEVTWKNAVPTNIYGKPILKLSDCKTGKSYLSYYVSDYYKHDSDCGTCIQFKKSGKKKWSKSYGPFDKYKTWKKYKLKPNKQYKLRTFYAKKIKYNGKSYTFVGKKKSKVKTVKTGKAKKPPVKSIKVKKAGDPWYQTLTIYYGGYGQVYYYWYTPCEITVKMKKKPGARGIYINSAKVAGNRTTYKTTLSLSGKLAKGDKVKMEVYSYQNSIYGGYSPSHIKTVKIK